MGVVLYDPDGVRISLSFKLEFSCSNYVAEYETLLLGLISALKLGVRKLRVQGDSKLIIEKGCFSRIQDRDTEAR